MGLLKDLKDMGLSVAYEKFVLRLEPVLESMSERGIPVSPAEHARVTAELTAQVAAALDTMQRLVPDECKLLLPKLGYKREPKKLLPGMVQRWFPSAVEGVQEQRWCRLQPWKPSQQGLVRYMKHRKHPVPRAFRTDKETTAELELRRLSKSTRDPLYAAVIEYRELKTLLSNHVANWKPGADGRVHPTFYYETGTGQLGARRPNSMNAPKHKPNQGDIFRSMIVAKPGHTLVECVAPETRILMHDLTWKDAGKIQEGDSLWGFDEFPQSNGGKRSYSALRKSEVLNVRRLRKPCITIRTDKGEVTCSTDHLWKRRSSSSPTWTEADRLKVGQEISYFVQPWGQCNCRDCGWLAGILDGEGYGGKRGHRLLAFGQNDGPVASEAVRLFRERGFRFERVGKRRCGQYLLRDQAFGWVRALGLLRPVRLLPKAISDMEGMATWGKNTTTARILSIEQVGEQEVVAIHTTTHTFIAEGMLSHNCDYKAFHVQTLAFEARDPDLLRLAKLDIHSFLTAHFLRLPEAANLSGKSTAELYEALKRIKTDHKHTRDAKVKHALLGYNNGMGFRKCYYQYMEFFESQSEAKRIFELLDSLFPRAKQYRQAICDKAHQQGYLISRFGCIRWFWEVYKWAGGKWAYGDDHEAALSFFTQNDGHCTLKDAMLRIDAAGYGAQYRMINPMHDALMFEVPDTLLPAAVPALAAEMERPSTVLIDPEVAPGGLQIEVEVSVGKCWRPRDMRTVDWRTYAEAGH